jgi:hypothetical protein
MATHQSTTYSEATNICDHAGFRVIDGAVFVQVYVSRTVGQCRAKDEGCFHSIGLVVLAFGNWAARCWMIEFVCIRIYMVLFHGVSLLITRCHYPFCISQPPVRQSITGEKIMAGFGKGIDFLSFLSFLLHAGL